MSKDVIIRAYQDKDKEAVRGVCVATANGYKTDTDNQKKLLCLLFNDYYTENEPDTCFVAANDKDEAVGYIIAARDFISYKRIFIKEYLPQIYKLNFRQGVIRRLTLTYEARFAKEYPAHLHIDIHDGYQRMGLGHKLMQALLNRLKELKVKGVCLFVGATNEKGINFYKKLGFTQLKQIAGAICFGLKLEE